ncbi:MAG: hypothetical protein JJU26_00095 [Oceanicaulis sp.]|uniref:GNAT family N-acetyltransferase n=1 Tax=Glycocaulis sp. TaxID=1969725 RepID=UPI0025C0D05E|nr:GNAT family N-acetyltransferase [Glycocaulis sp.]MCC5980099.1 hypothetical protein [Oceanicaulis sp.]MCH8520541.1 GNAT family N-acetyltransferase [Glycocaulis sp.]
MPPAPTYEFRTLQQGDIDDLIALSGQLALKPGSDSTSFLVSNFTRAEYQRFLSHKDVTCLGAFESDTGALAGFLIAYGCAYASTLGPDTSEAVIVSAVGQECRFKVIKQVGIHIDHHGKGLGRALYEAFFRSTSASYVFAAIVEQPVENAGSKKFHAALGFAPVLQSSPANTHYESQIINTIWLRQLRPPVPLPSGPDTLSQEILAQHLEHARLLYMHEDQLNWVKLGTLLTLMFAILTASWFLLASPVSWTTAGASIILSGLGLISLLAIRSKMRSGAAFLASHKTALRLTEAMLAARYSPLLSPIWHVPLKSQSVEWLTRLPTISLAIWAMASIVLIGRLFLTPLAVPDIPFLP